MKNIYIIIALFAALVGCQNSSDEEVAPNILGVYTIHTLHNMEGEVLQFPELAGDGKVQITSEIEITRLDDRLISILRKGIAFGTPYTDPLGLFEIHQEGRIYAVYKDGLYIGTLGSKEVFLNFAGKSQNTMISSIRANR